MQYKVSPLNLFSAIVFGVLLVSIIEPNATWGWMLIIYLAIVIIISILVDYFIQKFSKSHFYTWIIESILLFLFLAIVAKLLY